jgi:site-specific DNA-methyltransferase (cytosine-N4-specific)
MWRLLKNGYNAGKRPSGHIVSDKWQQDLGGAIPKNLLRASNKTPRIDMIGAWPNNL